MNDLWIAIAAMTAISAVMGMATAIFGPKRRQPQMVWIALTTFGMFAFLLYAAGRLYWAKLIPVSAVIVWSNWTPLLAAVAGGICWHLDETPRWRRLAMSLALSSLAVAAVCWPFLNMAMRPQPRGGDVWNGPVAMQTSWATCSPAAAATFLNAGDIPISEADMIPRCLTDASGTPTLGLYRGLKLIANNNNRDVKVASLTLSELVSENEDWPILLMVKLPMTGVDDPRYAGEWGWIPGMGHSVVALGRSVDGQILIADPSKGMEAWTQEDLQVLWHGDAISFVNE